MKILLAMLVAAAASAATTPYVDAEVRKVDKAGGKVTLKHGPLKHLDMPAMTMVFKAKEPAMLEPLKVGDKVRFKADRVQGAYVVTEIQAAQ